MSRALKLTTRSLVAATRCNALKVFRLFVAAAKTGYLGENTKFLIFQIKLLITPITVYVAVA